MNDGEFIDIRDQFEAYVESGDYKYITVSLLNGDRYIITDKRDVLVLARVVFIFTTPGTESCFLFEAICNIDLIRKRES